MSLLCHSKGSSHFHGELEKHHLMKRGSLTPKDFQLKAMIPNGWLVDPKSLQRLLKVLMDKWDTASEGTPSQFRNRRKVDLEPAIETLDELIEHGWRFVAFHEEFA